MQIAKLEIKNFYSIQDATVEISDLSGIVLIEGINRDTGGSNGAGKSIIVEAISWGIFGKSIRKSKEETMVNNIALKNCKVTVTFNNGLVIKRSRRPTSLSCEAPNEVYTKDHANQTQLAINELLGTDYKTFMASMVFGQHNTVDFLSSSSDDKRQIIKNFLNLEYVFELRSKIKNIKSEHNQSIKITEALINEIENELSEEEAEFETAQDGIEKPEVDLSEILEAEEKIRKLFKWQQTTVKESRKQEEELRVLEKKIDKGVYARETDCPVCDRPIPDEQTEEKLQELLGEKTLLTDVIQDCSDDWYELEKDIQKSGPIISSQEYSKNLDLYNLSARKSDLEKSIETKKKRIAELEEKRNKSSKDYAIMKFWEKAFSEQGVIKFVIRNILDYFNTKCNIYLAQLTNSQFFIEFDEQLQERILINGREIHHCSLSGGEKRKINIAVMLALQSLLSFSGKQTSNLLFFDEITENMDGDAVQGLYILLAELKKEKTIFLITHNELMTNLLEDSTKLVVKKKNGISTIKVG